METITNEKVLDFNLKNKHLSLEHARKKQVSINLTNPVTIQDKLEWINIYDINPLKWECADKIRIHDYCKRILGKDICVPIIKTYNHTKDINWDILPKKFVIKCNHGSGMNILVPDKTKANKQSISTRLDFWLKDDFSFRNGFESHYHWIKPMILIEEYMFDSNQKTSLYDYKFWCFNGVPKMYTINDGNGHGDIMYYKMDDSEYNLYGIEPKSTYKKPTNFNTMVEYAKKLCEPFKFVRVDFYEVDNKIYLGEMTFTPGCCHFKYISNQYDIEIGKMLNIK